MLKLFVEIVPVPGIARSHNFALADGRGPHRARILIKGDCSTLGWAARQHSALTGPACRRTTCPVGRPLSTGRAASIWRQSRTVRLSTGSVGIPVASSRA